MFILILITYVQVQKSNDALEHLREKSLPIQKLTLELATSMDEQKAALIRHLVEKDTLQRMLYAQMEAEIEDQVRKMIIISEDPEEESIIQQVDWLMDELDARGKLVLSMDESVDENYLEISEAIDDIDDLLDKEIVPYVDQLKGTKRGKLEESTGELETGIQECLLALAEYIMQNGAEESREEFLEARSNIQLWESIFIEEAQTLQERRWARQLNESMDNVILKADVLMINFDRRMEEYREYSEMEIDADEYIENNMLALGTKLVTSDLGKIRKDKNIIFFVCIIIIAMMIGTIIFNNYLRRKREAQLRAIELEHRDSQMKAILQSQEEERGRYAQDLHDGYGQLIAVLNLNFQAIQRKSKNKDTDRMFESTKNVLQSMSDNLRRICFGLMPHTLKERGLIEGLKELAYKINASGAINVSVQSEEEFLAMDENVKIMTFRICQEWLNNIIKHSKASNVVVKLINDYQEFSLIVEDDGKGFDKKNLFNSKGHGWKNIQSRSRILGGNVTLETAEDSENNKFHFSISVPSEDQISSSSYPYDEYGILAS